jgi:hypothetical protein
MINLYQRKEIKRAKNIKHIPAGENHHYCGLEGESKSVFDERTVLCFVIIRFELRYE